MPRINLDHASVRIPIYNARGRSLKSTIARRAVGATIGSRPDQDIVVVNALKNISLSLNPGDRVGIIGHNGAGKSTLLRVLSGAYVPTSGSAEVIGEVSALTDIAMGLDPEASGHENIIMRAILMGMSYQQARALAPEVEQFSELGEYLDLPVRTYSTGMMLRLAFAVTTSIQPDILIMDEMITAGDASFIEKATRRIHTLIAEASIFALASHSEEHLKRFCSRAIWLNRGELAADGPLDSVLAAYNEALT
jgi:ABC-2 type transport system ATP-binding protein/lipopolysaccharide transport system ATP-binding protein